MKKSIYLLPGIAILISILGISANAQSRNHQQLLVKIPFAFEVGETLLPAGEYSVSIVNPSASRSVLRLKSNDGRFTVLTQTTDIIGWATDNAKLTFRHYGERYFLAQVWMASESNGLAAPRSSSEKNLQRQLGTKRNGSDIVAVNAHK
jgi:hypothetical protein